MLRPIINAHKDMNLIDSAGAGRRVWGLMEKDGTYIVSAVIVCGVKWYLRCFRSCVESFDFFVYIDICICFLLSNVNQSATSDFPDH